MQRNVVTKSFLRDKSFVAIAKLSATWLLGLMLGAYIGLFSFDSLRPWIFAVCMKSVTFFSAALALLLPLLLTVCLVYLLPSDSVLIAAVLKAASFAFVVVSSVLCAFAKGMSFSRLYFCWLSASWIILLPRRCLVRYFSFLERFAVHVGSDSCL